MYLDEQRAEVKTVVGSIFKIAEHMNEEKRRKDGYIQVCKNIEIETASRPKFYNYDDESLAYREWWRNDFADRLDPDNAVIFEYLRVETESPFSFFSQLVDMDLSDILMSENMIKVQYNSTDFDNFHVPSSIKPIIRIFLERIVENQKFNKSVKLDAVNGIIDTSFENYRFNITDTSLNAFGSYVVSLRKHIPQVYSMDEVKLDAYENSLGVDMELLNKIKERSNGSFIIFGSTGSGKTTLLRMLVNNNLDDKRNVCVIEDLRELYIETPLSFVTNKHYNIKQLFTAALRQNPSHIIVGETRTDEIVDILESALTMKVGTTIHADSFEKAVERLYFMSLERQISKPDMMDLVKSSIDMFIHMKDREIIGVWLKEGQTMGREVHEIFEKVF